MQYFFTKDVKNTSSDILQSHLSQDLVSAGVTDFVKLEAMPLDKNKILLRLTNMEDFLSDDETKSVTIDVYKVFLGFWQSANNKTESELPPDDMELQVEEKTLTNNMALSEMQERKI